MKRILIIGSVAAALGLGSARGSAQTVYWTETIEQCTKGVVRRADVGSAAIEDLVTIDEDTIQVRVDADNRMLYWAESAPAGDTIRRSGLDGSNPEDVITTPAALILRSFALDLVNGKMLVLEVAPCSPCGEMNCSVCSRVRRCNLDGGDPETLFDFPGNPNPSDIAVDPAAGKIYWCDTQYSPFISRVNFDGSNVEPLITNLDLTLPSVSSIALDIEAGKMYFGNSAGNIPGISRLSRANLDGTDVEDLIEYPSSQRRVRGVFVDADCDTLYWAVSEFCTGGTGKLVRSRRDGSQVEDFRTNLKITTSIAVDRLDADGDLVSDCIDGCPDDANKTAPGTCGCGQPDVDTDGDLTPDCLDECPDDADKVAAGSCGCGQPDSDTDGNGLADCLETMPMASTPCCGPGTAPLTGMILPAILLSWRLARRSRRSKRTRQRAAARG